MSALLPVATPKRTLALLGRLVRAHRWLAVAAAVCLLGAAAVSMVTAPLLGRVVDLAVTGGPITGPVLLLAAIALAQGGLAYAGLRSTARLGEQVLAALREDFVAHALDLPLERIEQGGSGDLTSRITEDVAMVSTALREAFPEFIQSALVIVLTVVGLAALDWRFGAAALLAVPIQAWTSRWYLGRSSPLYARRREAAGGEQQQLLDSLSGAVTVRAFRLGDDHVARVGRRVDRSIEMAVAVTRVQTRFFGRLNLAELVGLGAVLIAGFLLVRGGVATIGAAAAAALYFANLFTPINGVLFLLDTFQSATASLARLVGVVEMPAQTRPRRGERPSDGSIKAVDLRYAYLPGQDVLHGIELDVPTGATVALVGGSGGGKTTLAKLLAGVHDPTGGAVRIGGVALEDIDADTMRTTVALVTQEVHVFAGTLAEDLRLVRPDAGEPDLWAALDAVGAADWARALPDGLDAVVGDGGHDLTVVQAQQLALARLLLLDPLVAILDEATAEAGSTGARLLEKATTRVLRDRTAIVVAHRLTQAASADLVVVLDQGRVVEHGTHHDLVAAGGHYARLWAAWTAGRS
ncbi:ABC transporter ATP-binding protein [Actinosynnema sp. NPDC047251]|uniref:Putative membrane protein n=1 Tax=Saccharothrix espanaensis (strain ATCC 51144 / DSM 44229 / JCM 9112 / NBRC 15066 / NRRL 15764) TaxID=1179773 RepID=K0K2K9_SACES|nr:ABC transporter ATP-binding protein [Saccharothrix espanaensis]CCH30793.1 putative membrane protein [Saccharothrix espanaensis DSM 44229]